MDTSLSGRIILVAEDEPLIAFDIATSFQRAGADVAVVRSMKDALGLVECAGISAAIVDFGLVDGDANALCLRPQREAGAVRLTQRVHPHGDSARARR
jgi:DNA-binding response OmpR family regulator